MNSPHLEVFDERELIGSGACGAVFRGVDADGRAVAVKLLDGMAVHRGLLEKACARLEQGGWPEGVMEVVEADFRARPAVRVTLCHADPVEGGGWRPRSLQHRLDEFPGELSWPVVLGLAQSLAAMHGRQVAHGNLKPGNVFLDEDDRVLLTDWALGHMPGVAHLDFTDAVLYQPPDQLRDPGGYLEERGYRWDVYAFGVLAVRLLTGSFPRCDEAFRQVAPLSGETTREGVEADHEEMAAALEQEPVMGWPTKPSNRLEECFRGVVEQCLVLDPVGRPANAMEVRRMFLEAQTALEEEEKLGAALGQRRASRRAAWQASGLAAFLAVALVVTAGFLKRTQRELAGEVEGREREVTGLRVELEASRGLEVGAMAARVEAEEALRVGRSEWLARVEAGEQLNDRLFAWAMEQGNRALPPLDGRELRLARLEGEFRSFIDRTVGVEGLEDERSRAWLKLGEIALAQGDPVKAEPLLAKALAGIGIDERTADLELRLAADRLLLALLWQERGELKAEAALAEARRALEALPVGELDGERVVQLLSILDVRQARELATAGDEAKALQLLHRATQTLNALADGRPDAAVLRSELVSCYLSSATILEGMGELGDARTARMLGAEELLRLIEESPEDLNLQVELAGCYGAVAESSLLAGDVENAEAYSKAAVKLLAVVLPQRPDSAVVRSRLAAQRGLMAGILRDRGRQEEALALYEEGLRLLEGLTVGEKADPLARYRFALLLWEKGRMLGFSGERGQELELEERAAGLLEELLVTAPGAVRREQIGRSLGYVLGDLGHAAQLAGNPARSRAAFAGAVRVWEELLRERRGSEEYEEALEWSRQRLEDLP